MEKDERKWEGKNQLKFLELTEAKEEKKERSKYTYDAIK